MRTLEDGQRLLIHGIAYEVMKDSWSALYFMCEIVDYNHDTVFTKLGLDKKEFTSQFYPYDDEKWDWPPAPNLESLTRCVEALINHQAPLRLVEAPVVTIEDDTITIHNLVNSKGLVVLSREEAALLYVELHKFLQ